MTNDHVPNDQNECMLVKFIFHNILNGRNDLDNPFRLISWRKDIIENERQGFEATFCEVNLVLRFFILLYIYKSLKKRNNLFLIN
jgi:hypothetical protein